MRAGCSRPAARPTSPAARCRGSPPTASRACRADACRRRPARCCSARGRPTRALRPPRRSSRTGCVRTCSLLRTESPLDQSRSSGFDVRGRGGLRLREEDLPALEQAVELLAAPRCTTRAGPCPSSSRRDAPRARRRGARARRSASRHGRAPSAARGAAFGFGDPGFASRLSVGVGACADADSRSRTRSAQPPSYERSARSSTATIRSGTASRTARSCETSSTVPGKRLERRLERLAALEVEMVRRLVEDEQVRARGDDEREREPAPLAAREHRDLLLVGLPAREQEAPEEVLRLRPRQPASPRPRRRGSSRARAAPPRAARSRRGRRRGRA